MTDTPAKKMVYEGNPVQVESAIRDGTGKVIADTYAKKPAVYERTTYSSTSTTCTLIQFNASDYKANGYLAHFRFRVRSVLQDAYPSDNEFTINYSYRTTSITCTNNKKTATNDIVQNIFAYYPSSDTYLDTGSYFIAFTTGRASTNFIIEMIEADVPYTIPATMSASTTTNTLYQSLTPGLYSSSYPLMWTGSAVGNIKGSSSYSAYSERLQKYRSVDTDTEFYQGSLCGIDSSGLVFKLLTAGKKFPLPIILTSFVLNTIGSPKADTNDYETYNYDYSSLSDSNLQGGSGFTCPTLTVSDGGKSLYLRGSLDTVDGKPVFVPDGNITLDATIGGYTYIRFGEVFQVASASTPNQFYWDFTHTTAYTLDTNGKLTHIDGKQTPNGSVQLLNQSVTFDTYTPTQAEIDVGTYAEFPYKASVSVTGVTSSTYAEVTYSEEQATSLNFATFCDTATDVIYLYSRTNVGTVTIPTISIGMDYSDITIDATPTSGSGNAVSSGGVYDALESKADDSDVVHITDAETITGLKTINVNSDSKLIFNETRNNTSPLKIVFQRNGSWQSTLESKYTADYVETKLAGSHDGTTWRGLALCVGAANNTPTAYVIAPYRTSGITADDVLTAGNGVTLSTNQTVNGFKTFMNNTGTVFSRDTTQAYSDTPSEDRNMNGFVFRDKNDAYVGGVINRRYTDGRCNLYLETKLQDGTNMTIGVRKVGNDTIASYNRGSTSYTIMDLNKAQTITGDKEIRPGKRLDYRSNVIVAGTAPSSSQYDVGMSYRDKDDNEIGGWWVDYSSSNVMTNVFCARNKLSNTWVEARINLRVESNRTVSIILTRNDNGTVTSSVIKTI